MNHKRTYSNSSENQSFEISSDLAQQIIDKELELEKLPSSKVVHELNTLYSKAVEYYEQQDNPKYLDFQEKMQKMLVRPKVLAILQKENCKSVPSEPIVEINPSPIIETEEVIDTDGLSKRKEQAELVRKKLSKQLSLTLFKKKKSKNFNIIIDRHSNFSKDTSTRAVADFKSQESALERRLLSRKTKEFNKSMTMNSSDRNILFNCEGNDSFEELNTSTKSSLFIIEEQIRDNYEKLEKKLESVMEKNFGERAMKIAEVKFKYESQINEFNGEGEIMNMLVAQMKTNMQNEIDEIMKEFDLRRKDEIKRLKEELYN